MTRSSTAVGLLLVAAASCASVADWVHAAETRNRLATNRLAQNRLATNRLASNRLAQNALSSTRLRALDATAEMLETEEGRDLYSYLVNCALPSEVTIEATVPGAPDSAPPDTPYACTDEQCVFEGGLGLAPEWIDRGLGPKGRRWVSACIFARVNNFATTEAISLRGDHPNLAVSVVEAEEYTVEEGAFYGDLFTRDDDPIDANACRGSGQASSESGGLALRDCAEPDPTDPTQTLCGFNYAGDCRDFTPESPNPYACKTFDAAQGIYGKCHDTAGEGRWPRSTTYREVISVYVLPD